MLKTTHYIAIAAIIILLFALFLFRDKLKKLIYPPQAPLVIPTSPAITTTTTTTGATVNLDKVLRRGATGEEVRQLQSMMGGVAIDGDFGPQTENRLFELKGVREITLRGYPLATDLSQDADNSEDSWFDYLPYNYIFQ